MIKLNVKTIFVFLFIHLCFGNQQKVLANASKDTTIIINGNVVILKYTSIPPKGTILLLQGWNFPPTDWCNHSTICQKALEKGYNLVMPDMGKSIYHSTIYKETRADWVKYPTRKWLIDTLFVFLQKKYGLIKKGERNFAIGLSTGARGAVLIALDCPDLFTGIAALSGDYNQVLIPNDNLCKGYYGSYSKFKNRWKTIDNPFARIREFKTPIYLGHGLKDKVVPSSQSVLFYKELLKQHPSLKMRFSTPQKEHNYQFWANEVDSIFVFFDKL
jgi:S-formylglutathione hydrolase FrmB